MGFLDKIGEKASEVYNNTAEKTNKISKELKLKSQINENNSKINKLSEQIGKKVYEKFIKDEEINIKDYLSEELNQIKNLEKENESARISILELKDMKLCEKCSAEIKAVARFCPVCGTQQQNVKVPEKPKTEVEKALDMDIKVEEIKTYK